MQSHCLKHQERLATARCAACSIPLCDECTQLHEDAKYCSKTCYQSVLDGQVRSARRAVQEEALRTRRQTRAAIKTIFYIVLVFALFFAWDSLPESFTGWAESLFETVKGAFTKGE